MDPQAIDLIANLQTGLVIKVNDTVIQTARSYTLTP